MIVWDESSGGWEEGIGMERDRSSDHHVRLERSAVEEIDEDRAFAG